MNGTERQIAALVLAACATLSLTSPARAAQPNSHPISVGERFAAMNTSSPVNSGGWHVQSLASLRAGYDDNIISSAVAPARSPEIELRGSMEAARALELHTFTASAAIAQTWYSSSRLNDDTEVRLGATAALRPNPRLVLRGAVDVTTGRESNALANGIEVNGVYDPYTERAQFRRLPMEAGLDYEFGRWSFSANAEVAYVDFDPQATRAGMTIDQGFRSGRESEIRTRAAYEIDPTLSLFGELVGNRGRFDDSNGDDDGWRIAGGAQFAFLRLLVGEAYAGYASQRYLAGGEVTGFTFGTSLNWYADELVSFTFGAKRELRADQVTTASAVVFAVPLVHDELGARAEYEPLRQLLVFGQAKYERDRRNIVNRSDALTTLTFGGTYVVTRNLRLVLDYVHEAGTSEFAGDHARNRVSVGAAASY